MTKIKAAVIVFPGSNCDRDMITTIEKLSGNKPYAVWHQDTSLPDNLDLIVLPGGFSYGDYLRSGAIAARSPIMTEVIKAAKKDVYILGICNGFQILTEAGLLPGTLMRNKYLKFIGKDVNLRIANSTSDFTKNYAKNENITLPIAHHDGNYYIDNNGLKELEDNNQVAFRYTDESGNTTIDANPNGALNNIAGVFNKNYKILGMMPHPERSCDPKTGGIDGIKLFKTILKLS